MKKDPFLDNVIYIIQSEQFSDNFSLDSNKKIFFGVLNLNEYKFKTLIELKSFWFIENSIEYIEKEKILLVIDNNMIIFFKFDWKLNKIFKRKIVHTNDICCLTLNFNSLILGDKDGVLTVYKFKAQKYYLELYENNLFYLKKIKSWNFLYPISTLLSLDKNNIVLNLFGISSILFLNFKNQQKKYFNIDHIFYISNIIGIFGCKRFLIYSSDCVIFFSRFGQKIKISTIRTLNLINSIISEKNKSFGKKIYHLKIFPCLALSNSTFLLIGPGNDIHYFDMEENVFKFRQLKYKKKTEKNFVKCVNSFECDVIGRNIFLLYNFLVLRKIIYKKKTLTFSNLVDFSKLYVNIYPQTGNLRHFVINRTGKLMAMLFNNLRVNILETAPSFSKNMIKVSITLKKKITALSFFDENFLIMLVSSYTLVLWQFYPKSKKVKSCSLDIKNSIRFFKILSGKRKRAVICSLSELLLFDIETFTLIWEFEIKVLDLVTDKWSDKFIIKTKYLSLNSREIRETITIFEAISPIPVLSFNPIMFFGTSIISFCFSYFYNKNCKKSIVCLDSLLNFHKVFY